MKRFITAFLSFTFLLVFMMAANAQSHSFNPGCRYFKTNTQIQGKAVTGGPGCSLCSEQRENERKARLVEDKRRAETAAEEEKARQEKIKADKAAAEAKQKKEAEERKQREEAQKDFEEYSRNQDKYLNNLKIDINKPYSGYDAIKASQRIPVKIKSLKLVENKFAKQYELYNGDELVKAYSEEQYWVRQLHKDLPYFIINERKRKMNQSSIVDSKGEPIAISGEKYFESIWFNDKNNTIQFEVALEAPELLYRGSTADNIGGIYSSKTDVNKLITLVEFTKEKKRNTPDDVDSRGNKTVKIAGFSINFNGYSVKRIIAGIDLAVLEIKTVYKVP